MVIYSDDANLVQFMGMNNMGHLINFSVNKKITCIKRLIIYFSRLNNLL